MDSFECSTSTLITLDGHQQRSELKMHRLLAAYTINAEPQQARERETEESVLLAKGCFGTARRYSFGIGTPSHRSYRTLLPLESNVSTIKTLLQFQKH